MEWLDGLTSVLGFAASAAGGGIFGLIGSGLTAFFKHKKEVADHKLRMEEKREDRAHIYKMHELNAQDKREADEHELAVVSQAGSYAGLKASYDAVAKQDVHRIINDIRSLFRMALTAGLVVIVVYIFDTLTTVSGEAWKAVLSEEGRRELVVYIVYSTVFTAFTCVMWWFGDRALAPPKAKHR